MNFGLTRVTLNMDEVQEASASSSAPTTRERESDSRDSSPSGGSDCISLATKRRRRSPKKSAKSAGRFKHNWSLPRHIASSSKGCRFAYCRLCDKHFPISHGGFNDVKRHVNRTVHQRRIRSAQGSADISNILRKSQGHSVIHSANVTSAENMMVKFIAMHNLSFKAAHHLSELLPSMFPDSAIAADFACKRTKNEVRCLGSVQ